MWKKKKEESLLYVAIKRKDSGFVTVSTVAQMARHSRARRIAQPAAVGGDRMSWTAISGHIVRSGETKGHMLSRKATARRYRRHLTALWSPVKTRTSGCCLSCKLH